MHDIIITIVTNDQNQAQSYTEQADVLLSAVRFCQIEKNDTQRRVKSFVHAFGYCTVSSQNDYTTQHVRSWVTKSWRRNRCWFIVRRTLKCFAIAFHDILLRYRRVDWYCRLCPIKPFRWETATHEQVCRVETMKSIRCHKPIDLQVNEADIAYHF